MKLPPLPTARSGTLGSRVSISKNEKGGHNTILKEKNRQTIIPNSNSEKRAMAGKSIGLTIPGPERSYMTARVDVWVSLPSGDSENEIKQTLKKAGELVQSELAEDARDVKEFFRTI